ncbi:MAG: MFS transporter [Candidatus Acididesulfobacter guangdongensis]|uniref:MFS transporter n=1 Tax=Acididesulfobacter guangdongensis TaxID=2597225 RepID=A0A519BJ75_ACIG2|nr:MAG: MFS transporter [Candidatus Acididesulfobacter guangdongensis]
MQTDGTKVKNDIKSDSIKDTGGKWLNSNVLFISLSAFFADLGYQAVLVMFPIFLVLDLHSSIIYFGIASAISYGIGAFFGYFGGRAGDRFGHKKIAIIGNLLIPLLSFTGFSIYPAEAVAFFSTGWWSRNFRSPSRRVLLSRSVFKEFYGKAFGFLHALDEGGGFFAGIYALILFAYHVQTKFILLITVVPLLISTFFLTLISKKKLINNPPANPEKISNDNTIKNNTIHNNNSANIAADNNVNAKLSSISSAKPKDADLNENLFKRILIATSLYGFSSFSFGFPILTIAQSSKNDELGILSYILFFAFTSLTGLIAGKTILKTVKKLGFGYFLTFIGSSGMAAVFFFSLNPLLYYVAVAFLGVSLGIIETLEPTAVSIISKNDKRGKGMGALTAARSIGIFGGNIIMGLLYSVGADYSYLYAGLLSLAAAIIIYASKSEI